VELSALLAAPLLAIAMQNPKPAPPAPGWSFPIDWRLRAEQRTNATFSDTAANDPHDLLSRFRLGINYRSQEGWNAFVQPQWAVTDNSHRNKPLGTVRDLDIHQGYLDFTDANRKWRIGRQEMLFGDARLIGNGNWSSVGRSFDGARLSLTDRRSVTDLFVSELGQSYQKTSQPLFAGIYSTVRRSPALAYDLYALYKDVKVTATTNQHILTIGTRPNWNPTKQIQAKVEAAYQFGTNEARPVSAWAYAAVGSYTFPGKLGLQFAVERDEASGGDPTGTGTYRTFDQLFPTNHQHYGIIDYFGWRNMEDWKLSIRANPAPRLLLQVDGHFFSLKNTRDFWYGDNGRPMTNAAGAAFRDPTGVAGRDLGTELDVQGTYNLSRHVALGAGYARFTPGSFVRATNAGKADTSDWFYLMADLKF
jgi:hypothetical protein